MRIDCEQCGAAYAIDDSLISERGVRAQCPKCGAQKVVKKEAAAPPAPQANPFAAPAPGASPFGGGPPPGASPFGGAPGASPFSAQPRPAASPFGGGGASPFAAPPSPSSAAGGDPFSSLPPGGSPFGGGAPGPAGPPPGGDPFGGPPGGAPFGGSPPSGGAFGAGGAPPAGGASGDPFANIGPGPGEDDPFAGIDPSSSSSSDPDLSSPWQVRPHGGELMSNVPLADVREMIRTGRLGPNDEAGPMGGKLGHVCDNPVLAVSLPKGMSTRRAQGASASGGGVPRSLAVVIALALLVGGGYVAFTKMPDLFKSEGDTSVNPFRRAKAQWSLQFPDVDGTSEEHVVEGKKHMRTDTAAGYRKADEHFRMALLLDVGNINAVAGYVENFSHLPNAKADADGVTLAFDGIEWALKKEPENGALLRAHGALKLAVGQVDDAQKILVQAKRLAPDDAMTKVLLARTHLERSVSEALSLVNEVAARDPELKETLLVAGSAQRRLGNFREARELLKKRLESDPANVDALKEMARLELDLGNGGEAVGWLDKLLEAEQKDVDAHLTRAKVAYQILGDLKKADGQLKFVIEEYENVAGELLLPVLVHAAFVKAELGELEGAQTLGERARGMNGGYPPAHYVLGRVYLAQGKLDLAKRSFETALTQVKAADPLFEPLVRASLSDVLALDGKHDAAIRELTQVIEYAPRGQRGYFALAAAHVKADHLNAAFTVMRKALDIDPRHELERPSMTDYPSSTRDYLAYAEAFEKAAAPEPNLPLKLATEGIIRYHAGQRDKARALFGRALKEDRVNHPASLYISVMDFEEGKYAGIVKRLKQAERTTAGSHTVTQLYLARAELAGGETEAAIKRFTDIIDNEPTLVQAKFSLGQAYVKEKRGEEALNLWRGVVEQAPDYLPVKRAIAELRAAGG